MLLINVCGASFSGTTMLDLMLGNAPDAASCGEVGAWYRPKRRDRVALSCPCGSDPCPRWGRFAGVPEDRFHREAFGRWGVRTVVDSTKALAWVLDANRWAADSGLRVVNVLIYKDPVTHAFSHWKRGTSLADARRRFDRYHSRFLGLNLPFLSVNYDRFVQSPADQLAAVCRAAGVPYFAGKERFWTWPHHNLFGNDGTRGQVGRAEGTIRPPGPFPPEFLRDLAGSDARRGPGARSRRLVEALELFDVAAASVPAVVRPGPVGRPGYWYYEEKLKRISRALLGRLRPARPAGPEAAGPIGVASA